MNRLPLKSTFTELFNDYKHQFINQYGRTKFDEIFETVLNSSTIRELLTRAYVLNVAPSGKDYTTCILSMSYFILARTDTRLMGAILILYMWDQKNNKQNQHLDMKKIGYTVDDIFGNLGAY